MPESQRRCETCKFADISIGPRAIETEDGTVIHQEGWTTYACRRLGGAGNINWNMDTDVFDCTGYEPKGAKK